MKLLLDENLSRRLVPVLQEQFPGSSQVVLLRLGNCTNKQVLEALLDSAERVLELLRSETVGVVEVG